jgi:hypothetical protein
MAGRTLDDDLRLSRGERLRAWALTGPPGRAWSFALDLLAALGALAVWGARALAARAHRR